jgi:hypothetical protein
LCKRVRRSVKVRDTNRLFLLLLKFRASGTEVNCGWSVTALDSLPPSTMKEVVRCVALHHNGNICTVLEPPMHYNCNSYISTGFAALVWLTRDIPRPKSIVRRKSLLISAKKLNSQQISFLRMVCTQVQSPYSTRTEEVLRSSVPVQNPVIRYSKLSSLLAGRIDLFQQAVRNIAMMR